MTESTWITDDNDNRCSVEYWGSEEEARKALASLTDCTDCTACTDCSRCLDCTACTGIAPSPIPEVPVIDGIHAKVFEAVSRPGALDMRYWHTCETTHCRAGFTLSRICFL